MVDQETKSVAPDASGAIESNALESPFGDCHKQSLVREIHPGETLAKFRKHRYPGLSLQSGQRSSRAIAWVECLILRFVGTMGQGRLEFHPPSAKKYCADSKQG